MSSEPSNPKSRDQRSDTGAAPSAQPEGRNGNLHLRVHNGNLRFVAGTLLVGHYSASKLSGSESVVDHNIGGTLSAALSLGLYPDTPGSHQSFSNARQYPNHPLCLPRPQHVLVVGLGPEGQLRSTELVLTVRQAVLAWAQRMAETPSQNHFELTAALVGSGGVGVGVGTSAQALAQGVREANDRLQAAGWPTVAVLHLVELYLDRASEAWRALQGLAQTAPEQYRLHAQIDIELGALPRPLDQGYRGTGHDFISAIVEKNDSGQPSITYTLDTQRARSEASVQATQTRLVSELVRRASNDASRDPDIGRTLFQLLIPQELETRLRGSCELLIEVNEGSAAIPWELLDEPNDGRSGVRKPWALRTSLLRKLRTTQFRPQVRDARAEDAVLLIGEPACEQRLYPPLPAARQEALAVAQSFLGCNGLSPERVFTLVGEPGGPGADATTILNALLARPYRVVHIAGHGEPELAEKGQPVQTRGVVLSDNTYLGPQEMQAMRVVPELVFLNCCYLAADARNLLKGYDRAAFAGNVAQQLIRMGVRCVVAAGWAVEDDAAQRFATTFYQHLLQGRRFMDAVHQARLAAWEASPQGNTWAAFQCYGDPDWVWNPDARDTGRAVLAPQDEYASIASPAALVLALQTLVVESHTQGASATRQREKIEYLQARCGGERVDKAEKDDKDDPSDPDAWCGWAGLGQVAEAFGAAWAAVGHTEQAVAHYRRALCANDASASVKSSEQLAHGQTRWAWERISVAQKDPAQNLPQVLSEARDLLQQAIETLQALLKMGHTIERETMLGAAYRRLYVLERVANDPASATQALANMLKHHRQAHALAGERGGRESFYAALNRLSAELLWQRQHDPAADLNAQALQALQGLHETLEHRNRHTPDFWSWVGSPQLATLQALASGQLAQQLPHILATYQDIHEAVNSPSLWTSVVEHADFVLHPWLHEDTAQGRACQQLLNQLQAWAAEDAG